MGYKETIEYIHSVQWRGSIPGLSRTQELLKRIGNPDKKLKFVHIAGTNGKGSTAACIASILQKAGYKTGLYISPYIIRFNERMQINGEHISDEALERVTGEIRVHAQTMEDIPTEFELITAIAMKYFADEKCDIVVLETGLGGELDSTNVIETPEVAVITPIGLDHTAELGPTLRDIAEAKAGIIKENGDVVIYGGDRDVEEVFEKRCLQQGSRLHKTDFSRLNVKGVDLAGCRFDFLPLKDITLLLSGAYQPYNASTAITAAEVLRQKGYKISDDDIKNGLAAVKWPGRFEILGREPVFILDGAHNPQGITATAESLKHHFGDEKIVFLLGVMADKDVAGILHILEPLSKAFITVTPDNPRAMAADKLAKLISDAGFNASDSPTIEEGIEKAIAIAGEKGIVCAIGSLYFSGDIRRAYEKVTNRA